MAKAPQSFALAGDTVLLSRVSGRTLTVDALPGGRVFRYQAPAGSVPGGRLAASAQRAAMTITLETDESDIAAAQVVSGPVLGPWATLRPMTELGDGFVLPYQHQLEGERLFTSEIRGSLTSHAVVVRDPDPRDLQLPVGAVFAGDLVAYTERGPGQDEDAIGRRLVVAEWRTGVRRGVTDLPEPIQQHALRPDGRVALTQDTLPGIYDVPLGGRPRLVTRRTPAFDHDLVFAGEHLVFVENDRLHVLDPDGRVRALRRPDGGVRRLRGRRASRALDRQRLPAGGRRHRARRRGARRRPVPAQRAHRRQRRERAPEPLAARSGCAASPRPRAAAAACRCSSAGRACIGRAATRSPPAGPARCTCGSPSAAIAHCAGRSRAKATPGSGSRPQATTATAPRAASSCFPR